MAALIQYAFNNENQWKSAGAPKLVDTATEIVVLGEKNGKYHVEVLFADVDDVPENGLLAAKAIDPIPHRFIGYETLEEYRDRKENE